MQTTATTPTTPGYYRFMAHGWLNRARRYTAAGKFAKAREAMVCRSASIRRYSKPRWRAEPMHPATNRVSASRLWEIARALGVEVGWFFEGLPRRNHRNHKGGK